jgi:TrmH family RNA methyltransferase
MLGKTKAKYIQSLYHKKFRDENGLFIIEGPRIVEEYIRSAPELINGIYAIPSWLDEHKNLLRNLDVSKLNEITPEELKKISSLITPNQVLCVVKKKGPRKNISLHSKITLVLDGIRDPGNLGTIVRIADWFGIENIICSPDCADIYNSKVVQATMGSLLRVNVIYEEPVQFLLGHSGIPVVSASLDGKNLYSFNSMNEGFILIGNESAGIRNELLQLSTDRVTIPRIGSAESLNAAVATGIILSHLLKPVT